MGRTRTQTLPALALAVLSTGATACSEGSIGTGTDGSAGAPALTRIEGAPTRGSDVDRIPVDAVTAPRVISVVDGVVAVGTDDGLLVGSMLEHDLLTALPVIADDGEADATGSVHTLARRTAGGVLVASDGGLFHSAPGMLLPSPLEETLPGASMVSLDALGSAEAEELWAVTTDALVYVAGGEAIELALPGDVQAQAAIAVAPAEALVVAAGVAYSLDLVHLSAVPLADGLGEVNGFDRADDGTVHVATDVGLLSLTREGALTLRTLAPAGEPGEKTLGVSAAFGSLVAITEAGLVVVDEDGALEIGEIASARGGVAVDATGDAWAIDGGELFRYATGEPVSFSGDVRPFFVDHCTSCHTTGEEGAPIIDLEEYDVAKDRGPVILSRLRAIGVSPMPPANVEILTAAEYGVVSRWIASGMKP
jgi:hypothetical protein